jgi:hypothetical protein
MTAMTATLAKQEQGEPTLARLTPAHCHTTAQVQEAEFRGG